MQTHRHQADILIIGGGVCGLNAALTAREQGRSVIVMDKAVIERSGHIAGGIDHFLAYMDTGAEWDTREAYLEFTGKSARGRDQHRRRGSVYCQELPHALKRFEEINCTLRQPDGTYYRTKSYGQPGPWWINFNGKRMKPLLAKAARKAGCAVLDRVVTADLLTNGGTVCGAAGFDIRTGDLMPEAALPGFAGWQTDVADRADADTPHVPPAILGLTDNCRHREIPSIS